MKGAKPRPVQCQRACRADSELDSDREARRWGHMLGAVGAQLGVGQRRPASYGHVRGALATCPVLITGMQCGCRWVCMWSHCGMAVIRRADGSGVPNHGK